MTSLGDLSLLFFILVSVGGATALLYGLHRWRDRRDAGLFRAADRLGGTVPFSESLGPRTLQFSIEGRPAFIEFERGAETFTRVKVAMSRRSPGVFRIIRQDVARASAKFIGSKDIRIGVQKFDRNWFVTARPESFAHRIFTEDRREQVIASILRLCDSGAPSVEITRDTLVVRVDQWLAREDQLMDLAQTAIDFVGYVLRLGPEEGIAWVMTGEVDPGLCPVCAAAMTEALVQCERCRTPHHWECWKYVGQCSTYACKGKTFVEGPVSGHEGGGGKS